MDNGNSQNREIVVASDRNADAAPRAIQLVDLNTQMAYAQQFAASRYFDNVNQAAQALVKIEYGRELGLAPVVAMLGIHFFEGKPTLSAPTMAALVRKSGMYDYEIIESDNDRCVIRFLRRQYNGGWKSLGEQTFTIEDARRAKLAGKFVWQAYPEAMCYNRAMSAGAKKYCPDVFLAPVYSPEELGADTDAQGNVIDVTPTPLPAPEPRPTQSLATEGQIYEIRALFERNFIDEAEALDKANRGPLSQWTEAYASKVIQSLQKRSQELDNAPVDPDTGEIVDPAPVPVQRVPEADKPPVKSKAKANTVTAPVGVREISSEELFGEDAMDLDAGMPK